MNISDYIDEISKIALFKTINKDDLLDFFSENLYSITKHKQNSVVYFQNELCSTMDILLEGNIYVQNMDEEGNVLTVAEFSPYDILGDNLIFSNRNTYPMNIISKTDAILLKIKKELVLELCHYDKEFLLKFLSSLSAKTIVLTDKISVMSMKSIREVIVDFLTNEYIYQKSEVIKLKISKKELAERFGIRRPSLSRELKKMREEGLIEFDAKTITIKDIDLVENK